MLTKITLAIRSKLAINKRSSYWNFKVLLFTFICLIGISQYPAQANNPGYTFNKPLNIAIFPRLNPVQSTQKYKPLINFLSHQLGMKVKLKTPKTFAKFWNGLISGKYDIVHFNQYHYVKSKNKYGYRVIVKNIEFKQATIAGAIIVRKDSYIENVMELKGQHIVFGGGPQAMLSYITARYLLAINGLKPGDYTESFALNPPNAIFSTYYRQSSASGTGDTLLHLPAVKNKIDTNQLRILIKGKRLAQLPWAVKADLPERLTNEIKTVFLNMHKSKRGRKVLKQLNMDGFAVAKDSDYDEHRKIIYKVLGEQY